MSVRLVEPAVGEFESGYAFQGRKAKLVTYTWTPSTPPQCVWPPPARVLARPARCRLTHAAPRCAER